MKNFLRLYLILSVLCIPLVNLAEIRPFLLTKREFQYLDGNNMLVMEALKNTFGAPTKQNYYFIKIDQVDMWTTRITEFKYYPSGSNDPNKNLLRTSINGAAENTVLKVRVHVDPSKTIGSNDLKNAIDDRNCMLLSIVVIGHPKAFVVEPRNKVEFIQTVDEVTFADKAFLFRLSLGIQ